MLSIAILLAASGTAVADCSKLNSSDFLEGTPWDQVVACVEQTPQAVIRTDSRGNNLLMTALTSDINPMQLDDLFMLLPEELAKDVKEATDRQGRSLGHIAAAEAPDPAFVFVLSANGVSLAEEINATHNPTKSGQTPLHFAAQREDGWLFVAALMALKNVVVEDDRGLTAFDIAMAKDMIGSEALLLAEGEWPNVFAEQLEPEQPSAAANCGNLLTSQFFKTAEESHIIACLEDENQLFAVDSEGNSILHLASLHAQDPWIIDSILNSADDPTTLLEKRNSANKTPLHLAAEHGSSPEALLHLLAWGANPDTLANPTKKRLGKDRGVSALHLAASRKDELRENMMLMLLAFEADSMIQDTASGETGSTTAGRTALHRVLMKPEPFVLLMLLEGQFWQENLVASIFRSLRGKFVKQISDDAGRTALHMAASRPSDFDTLRILVGYGFSVDQRDDQDLTPLMFAAQYFNNSENFLALLEASTNPCGTSKTGATVESALRSNKTLMAVGSDDTSGKTLSPLARLKQRCP
jgi:ankyrin repeat protein